MPTVSRAALIERFGDSSELYLGELSVPDPGPGQIQVRVHAASVNPVDIGTRAGRVVPLEQAVFPMALGWDVAGTVEAVGPGAALARGERVAALNVQPATTVGTYAERIVLGAELFAAVPAALDLETAATLPLAGLTAKQALDALALEPGQTLLVNGALGSVGRIAVQLGARAGIHVVAVVAAEDGESARELGARTVIDRAGDLAADLAAAVSTALGGPVDGAFDVVGGPMARSTFDAVADGGRYATVVPEWWVPGGPFAEERGIDPIEVVTAPNAAQLGELLAAAAAGSLVSPVAARFALSDAAGAHELAGRRGLRGKVVIVP